MSEEMQRELYDIITIPLGATFTDKAVPLDAEIVVVGQIPINVTCKINDVGNKSFSLELFRTIKMKIDRLYLTTTTTSSTDLVLFVSKGIEVGTAPPAGRTLLVDSVDIAYDSRDIVESEEYNDDANINDGNTKDSGELATSGYNKITGWVFSDRDLTIQCQTTLSSGGTDRVVATADHTGSATEGTAFEFPVVSKYMTIVFDNSSGGNTTTCETIVNLSTGA